MARYQRFNKTLKSIGLRHKVIQEGVEQARSWDPCNVVIDTSVYHNVAGVPRSRLLYTLLNNFMTQPNAFERFIKSLIPCHSRIVAANKAMNVLLQAVPMSPAVHADLKPYFSKDIELLEDVLQRDLRCWREALPETAKNVGREAVIQGSGS